MYAIKTNSSYRRFFHSSKPVFVALADNEPLKQYASRVEELIDGKVVIKSPKGLKLVLSRKFIEWFRGFSDAEASFGFIHVTSNYFQFAYEIKLHQDDIETLNYIRRTLGIGQVNLLTSDTKANFKVSSQENLIIILAIFSKYNLNTTKHLDFLAFVQAYSLYTRNKERAYRKEIVPHLKEIILNMNRKRTNLDLSGVGHEFRITAEWLLGFVEGDGSFFCSGRDKSLIFNVSQKGNLALLNQICLFLFNLYTHHVDKDAFVVKSGSNGICTLTVQRTDILKNILIPFFNSLTFFTKKSQDYSDWVAIFNIKQKGFHFRPDGKALIERILSQMNDNRLSTSPNFKLKANPVELSAEIDQLLSMPSNYEYKEDGRIWIISLKKYRSDRLVKGVRVISLSGTIIETLNYSIDKCAEILGISRSTLKRRLDDGQPISYKNQQCTLKRRD